MLVQEPTLFNCTIRENIVWGCPHVTEEQLVAAAVAANAHTFITKLPHGYVAQSLPRPPRVSDECLPATYCNKRGRCGMRAAQI